MEAVYRGATEVNSAMLRVYNNMCLAVITSMVVSYLVSTSPALMQFFFTGVMQWIVIFAPLAMIFAMTWAMTKATKFQAQAMLQLFAALMGLSMSSIFIVYTGTSIVGAFFGAAVLFVTMSVYGYFTKTNLDSMGKFMIVGLIAIIIAVIFGIIFPEQAQEMKPLGDGFIKLIKMVIAPVIFCTVALGIAQMGDIKKFGRIGGKALIYFEVVTTLALVIGLVVGEVIRPGAGFNIDPTTLDTTAVATYAKRAEGDSVTEHLLNIIPDTFFSAFTGGDLLQVLLVAILFGFACTQIGETGRQVAGWLDKIVAVFFRIIHTIVWLAPIGAFGAMAFTIGRYGLGSLVPLASLIMCFYITCFLFVAVVLGLIARLVGFSLWKFLSYIREELLITLGASSSEPALPKMIEKLTRLGTPPAVAGLVIPTGYSFNLDGTSIYLTLAILFLAQATNTDLSLMEMVTILMVAMLTSKGASGITGAGFVTLAATLSVVPAIPMVALATIVGIDRFMSECRAITNIIGNGVATLAVARWEGELDMERLNSELNRR